MKIERTVQIDANQHWVLFEACQHCMGTGIAHDDALDPEHAYAPAPCQRCQGSEGQEHRFTTTKGLQGFVDKLEDTY